MKDYSLFIQTQQIVRPVFSLRAIFTVNIRKTEKLNRNFRRLDKKKSTTQAPKIATNAGRVVLDYTAGNSSQQTTERGHKERCLTPEERRPQWLTISPQHKQQKLEHQFSFFLVFRFKNSKRPILSGWR
jgi:hypothetical protein